MALGSDPQMTINRKMIQKIACITHACLKKILMPESVQEVSCVYHIFLSVFHLRFCSCLLQVHSASALLHLSLPLHMSVPQSSTEEEEDYTLLMSSRETPS